AGSTERISMAELEQEKGFLEIDLISKRTLFRPVLTRPMIELPSINAENKEPDQILNEIESLLEKTDVNDKIVRLRINRIPAHVYNSINFRRLTELKNRAFHFDLKIDKKEEKDKGISSQTSIGKLNEEFGQFLKEYVIEGLKRDRLQELGIKYLSEKRGEEE
ncbi:MAG: hypothetical protein OEV55_09615, partial [candidate division Zixibacteria bacterium]|nr:hypothetical protein [candidate division Zixibacteria bacterium]